MLAVILFFLIGQTLNAGIVYWIVFGIYVLCRIFLFILRVLKSVYEE